ncbi:MAG: HAMP domain-containing sensor histidine kinase, partial [Pseudomonadota bacterium]
ERDVARRQREFVSIFSHELQTPMTVIDGVAHQLVRNAEKAGDDSARDKLKRIRAAVTRVSGLVESTLSAARVEEGSIRFSPTRMDLRGLIQDEVRTQEGLATQRHRFDLDLDALPENVLGDCGLLAQVFSNLISNAIKYSPEGGTVGIKATQREGSMQIAVSDEGVGIPTAEISRISERYFRASSAGDIKGTGLGLNLVRHIVELHGWRLQIDSALKEGSTFSIVLPLADDAYSEVA